jgi:ATP-dependent RNA helicase SUPV3L1/SUV3
MAQVCIIDEIQMMRDPQRGWAWTRALLGVCADEVHVCGEPAAVALVRELIAPCEGDVVTVNHYERMTPLVVADEPLGSIANVRDGDAIVCFGKAAIYSVSAAIEATGRQVAVIYGSLPPNTKLAMAAKFNDPNDKCKVLVATDAIGMGLNLAIRRVVFHSLLKATGKGNSEPLTVSQAKQIGGRAGRFGTQYGNEGIVTCMRADDMPLLKQLMTTTPVDDMAAGLHPTFEQIELFRCARRVTHIVRTTVSTAIIYHTRQ